MKEILSKNQLKTLKILICLGKSYLGIAKDIKL